MTDKYVVIYYMYLLSNYLFKFVWCISLGLHIVAYVAKIADIFKYVISILHDHLYC